MYTHTYRKYARDGQDIDVYLWSQLLWKSVVGRTLEIKSSRLACAT